MYTVRTHLDLMLPIDCDVCAHFTTLTIAEICFINLLLLLLIKSKALTCLKTKKHTVNQLQLKIDQNLH